MSLDDDIARVGRVLENYDSVELLAKDGEQVYSSEFKDKQSRPAPQIRFVKKIDGSYYVVEVDCENKYKKGADTSKGKVHFDGDRSKLNKTQRASLNGLEVLAKTLGVQIYVEDFEGTKNANKNGWYDPKDGSIHINLKAGMDGKGTMIFTAAHELTHFIRQWSPAKFRVLANFVTKRYTDKGISVRELMDDQIAKAKEDGRELTDEEALEEVVADSMETMLVDGSIMEMMAEIRQQDHGLWAKIKEWFRDFASKLQSVVDAYKGVQPDSAEGRMVADMKDMIGTLEALYMDALVDASENFDAGVQKITTEDSGGVKYSLLVKRTNGEGTIVAPENTSREDVLNYLIMSRKGSLESNTYFPVSVHTPSTLIATLQKAGINVTDKPIAMQARKARQSQIEEQPHNKNGTIVRHHAMKPEEILEVIDKLNTASAIIHQSDRTKVISIDGEKVTVAAPDNFAVFVTLDNGKECVAIVEFDSEIDEQYVIKDGQGEEYHTTVTVFEPDVVRNGEPFDYIEYLLLRDGNRELEIVEKSPESKTAYSETHATVSETKLSTTKVAQDQVDVNKKFSARDSAGNQLSAEQQEYFKDSKERDNQGRLRVMYRGDSTEITIFDRKKSSYSNLYGRGFYFTGSDSHAGQYGQATAYYLNITNPVSTTDCTITKEQMRKFLEAVAENEDDYSFENYGYGATVESVLEGLYTGKSDFAMLYDVSQTAIGDMVEAVELFNKTNGTNYDGFILDTETVIFNSAQAKRTDNHNPTANPDTRYSQRDVGRQEAVTQALEKENAKLREDVTELRELVSLQRQVTNGTKFTKTSVEAAARLLKQNANAKGSTQELMKLLNGLYEYIASTKELTWEGVKEQAQGAVDWLWEHIDRQGKPTEYAQDILKQLHGAGKKRISYSPSNTT